jgi:hypothetical protein
MPQYCSFKQILDRKIVARTPRRLFVDWCQLKGVEMSGHAQRRATEDENARLCRTSGADPRADPLVRGRRPRRPLWTGARSRPGGRLQTRGSAPPDRSEIPDDFRGSLDAAEQVLQVLHSTKAFALSERYWGMPGCPQRPAPKIQFDLQPTA